ncbi:MAG: dolichyl-phosphate beta-glucosyltransferase [Acidimicrobiales bacterium]
MAGDAAKLTVIVPAFNEALRLTQRATRLAVAAEDGALCPRTTELIVVDDGSTDETGWRAEELLASTFPRLRVLRIHDNAGKGAAIRLGTAAATAPIVLFMDADMSVDPSEIPRLVNAIGRADVAIGSRSHAESVVETDGMQRKVMGRTFNVLVSALTNMPFRDTQCGFKAFRTPLARVLFHLMRVQRFAFDVEVLCLARELRMDITEVPVHWREVGQSTVRTMADPLSMTRDVLTVRRNRERPNIPALAITPCQGERRRSPSRVVGELHSALGPNYPIMIVSEDQTLVLLPLCDPIEVHNVTNRLRRLPTRLNVRERSASFSQVTDLAPFKWVDAAEGGFIIASHGDVSGLVTQRPVEGWESLRSSAQPVRSPLHA